VDLIAVKCISQGLAVKIHETQKNSARKKSRRQGLAGKRARVGFMCEWWDFSRGYGQELQDTSYRVLVWGFLEDLKAKEPYLYKSG
jgi:hypothetical protein